MRITRLLDLSQDIYHNCPMAPNLSPPEIKLDAIGGRDGWTNEIITMPLHTGTHMDAPAHIGGLDLTLDQISIERFQGNMVFIPLTKKPAEPIFVSDLEPYQDRFHPESIVLLYTGWGEKRGWTKEWLFEIPYVSLEAARYLAEQRINGLGIDHYSIGGCGDDNHEIHRVLLGANIWIAEGLQLDAPELRTGDWHVMSLPIKVKDSSGAPCRTIALQYGV
ncbi:cyclase family protein [Paenibacillus solisilvae]|uniref:Cyclase family protein n=1 Tax=Paenibacillus solisilvae TaxID=2486751 RepID=A0ABW0VRY4_9BACL